MEFSPTTMLVHLLVLFVAPPFFFGVINRVKSIFSGRKGPSLFQLYFDIFKLMRKGAVYSRSTSWIFRAAPTLILSVVFFAGLLLPMAGQGVFNFYGDVILFAYLFALARFMIITAAMDTASSFEGMGASREATFGAFSELTMFMVIITLTVVTRSLSLDSIFVLTRGRAILDPSMILLFICFFLIMLAENSRMPVDDPNTHLELTMIHEVMILDYSGPDLAIVLYSASMKLFIFMAFASMIIFPNLGVGCLLSTIILLFKVVIISILIGIVESVTARKRLVKIPPFLISVFVLSLFAFIIAVFVRGRL